MKRSETALKMICNQWVGSSNLSSGTTHQEFQRIYIQNIIKSINGLRWAPKFIQKNWLSIPNILVIHKFIYFR